MFTVSKQRRALQGWRTWTLYSNNCRVSSCLPVLSVLLGCQSVAWWLACLNLGLEGGPEPCLAASHPVTFFVDQLPLTGSASLSLSLSLSPGPRLCLNEEGNLPWIMNGDLYVLWCEHLSGSHYAPIRADHGFREEGLHLLFSPLLFPALMQTMLNGLVCWNAI